MGVQKEQQQDMGVLPLDLQQIHLSKSWTIFNIKLQDNVQLPSEEPQHLQVAVGEMAMDLRRVQLPLKYWINLKGQNQDYPTQDTLRPRLEKDKRATKSFGWVILTESKRTRDN